MEILTSGIGLALTGVIVSLVTETSKKTGISGSYLVIILSLFAGVLYWAFDGLGEESKLYYTSVATGIYASANIFYNLFIKKIKAS